MLGVHTAVYVGIKQTKIVLERDLSFVETARKVAGLVERIVAETCSDLQITLKTTLVAHEHAVELGRGPLEQGFSSFILCAVRTAARDRQPRSPPKKENIPPPPRVANTPHASNGRTRAQNAPRKCFRAHGKR